MLYLGIDQHARQITISLRDEQGDVLQACQVSTQPAKINAFFQQLTRERLPRTNRSPPYLVVQGALSCASRGSNDPAVHCDSASRATRRKRSPIIVMLSDMSDPITIGM